MRQLFLVSLLLLAPALVCGQDLDAELQAYEASLRCKSLYRHAIGMEAFAKTRSELATKVLAKRYAKPTGIEPPLHVRYLLATVLRDAFTGHDAPASEKVLLDLCKKQKKPHDAWLQLCVDSARAKDHAEELRGRVVDKKAKGYQRAAAILALASIQDPGLLEAIPEALSKKLLPRKAHDRTLVLEACARALVHYKERGRKGLRPAALAIIEQLDAKQTDERTRLVVARFLQAALKAQRPAFDALGWKGILDGQAAKPGDGETRVRASFFSVQGLANRVVFVIDLSDSMLEPLGEAEVERLKRAMPEEAEAFAAKNRFEATKIVLAGSLRRLHRGMQFGIVAFGSTAELITPSMLQATPKNVKKAIAALESIPVGKPEADRPHGTLKGWTNLYGGLRLALKLGEKGAHGADDEYVEPSLFQKGADTIFLLSDGEPTWSDFEGWDLAMEGDVVGDGEGGGGTDAATGEEIQYYGPHFLERFLYADLERMTAFRNVSVHCIGIGEADPELLGELARIGGGTVRTFGGD